MAKEEVREMREYIIVEKDKKEFQMVLNQWRHKYHIWVLWVEYIGGIYHALIEREEK